MEPNMSESNPNVGESERRDGSCNCRGDDIERDVTEIAPEGRWLGETDVLEMTLPRDVQEALGSLVGDEPVETMDDWVDEARDWVGGAISVEDLCHADGETEHWGDLGEERYHFVCVYDAVALAALADESVDIRTKSPYGTVIEARAAGTDELAVSPSDAVFSVGVSDGVEPPEDGTPSISDVYSAVCPYVKAFPDRETYENWAATVPAATVAMPLSGATGLAAELVR